MAWGKAPPAPPPAKGKGKGLRGKLEGTTPGGKVALGGLAALGLGAGYIVLKYVWEEVLGFVPVTEYPSIRLGSKRAGGARTEKAMAELRREYELMEEEFKTHGLNSQAVKDIKRYYTNVEGMGVASAGRAQKENELVTPKKYVDLTPSLKFPTVRLVVLPLESAPELVTSCGAATKAVRKALPPGTVVFETPKSNLHCTVFKLSSPTDPVTDPLVRRMEGEEAYTGVPGAKVLEKEKIQVKRMAKAIKTPRLVIDKLLFTTDGTLILALVDSDGYFERLRSAHRKAFPGATKRQPQIIHITLARVLTHFKFSKHTILTVSDVCWKYTQKMKGKYFYPTSIWYVQEDEYGTVNGDVNIYQVHGTRKASDQRQNNHRMSHHYLSNW